MITRVHLIYRLMFYVHSSVMLAVVSGHLDVVQLLFDKGAIVTTMDGWVVSV